jgi:hypothetical protein
MSANAILGIYDIDPCHRYWRNQGKSRPMAELFLNINDVPTHHSGGPQGISRPAGSNEPRECTKQKSRPHGDFLVWWTLGDLNS